MIKISEDPLNVQEAINEATDNAAGAVNVFIGTVRGESRGKEVVRLEYESYDSMVISEIEKIVDEVKQKWPVKGISIHHRKGDLKVGDIAVVIVVSTPHRKESFEACQFTIDTLKERIPIWKKEIYTDGQHWVAAHP